MDWARTWQRWMKQWRVERPQAAAAVRDPADYGTAWGLELTVPTAAAPSTAAEGAARRAGRATAPVRPTTSRRGRPTGPR